MEKKTLSAVHTRRRWCTGRWQPHLLLGMAILLLCSYWPAAAQEKRALLIGIGSYPRGTGWRSLSSANDIRYLSEAMRIQGFAAQHIAILADKEATLEGIRRAAQKLINDSKPGDVVWLHFSGHGQQITDDDGDEADGYDEAWVPYGAHGYYDPTEYTGTEHLRDDEVATWVNALSSAVGSTGSVLVTVDACHSGTSTRTDRLAVVRGTSTAFKIPGAARNLYRPGGTQPEGFLSSANIDRGNVVAISASSPTQVNYEVRDAVQNGVGSLSYALALALQELPATARYADLFQAAKARVQAALPQQIPMLEGNPFQTLFSGQYRAEEAATYIDRWGTDTTFLVKKGTLHGWVEGTELQVKEAISGSVAGTATLIRCALAECEARPARTLAKDKAWTLELSSLPVPPIQLGVALHSEVLPRGWDGLLRKYVDQQPFLQPAAQAACWLSYLSDTGLVVLTPQQGIYYTLPGTQAGKLEPRQLEALTPYLQQLARHNFFRALPDGGPLADSIEWTLTYANGTTSQREDMVLRKGDTFGFVLRNHSARPVYYALVNILPDGQIDVLLPDSQSIATDFSLLPGEALDIPDNSIPLTTPEGREFLRVLVSNQPFDVRPVFNRQAPRRSGTLSSWEQAMAGLMGHDEGARRTRSISVSEVTQLTRSFVVQ